MWHRGLEYFVGKDDLLNRQLTELAREEPNEFLLARRYEENGQGHEASQVLQGVLQRETDVETKKRIFIWLAELGLDQGSPTEALSYWIRASDLQESAVRSAALDELHGRILFAQYLSTSNRNRDDQALHQAIDVWEQALALEPDREILARLFLDLGRAYRTYSKPPKAASYLHKALVQQPADKQVLAESHVELGLLELWDYDDPVKAIHSLETALEISPLRPPSSWLSFAYQSLAWAFLISGNAKDAVEAGKKGLEVLDPRDRDYQVALGEIHYTLGAAYTDMEAHEDLAVQHYQHVLEIKDDPGAYRRLGELYLKKRDVDQAFKMFEAVLAVDPDYPDKGDIYNAMGLCLDQMRWYREALMFFEKAREEQASISFKPAKLYTNIGVTHWRLNQFDEAAEAFKTALGLMRPKDKEYRKVERYLRHVQAEVSLGDGTS